MHGIKNLKFIIFMHVCNLYIDLILHTRRSSS